jgi:hypothetical protein
VDDLSVPKRRLDWITFPFATEAADIGVVGEDTPGGR